MHIHLIQGDVLDAEDCSLCNCVSLDFKMSKGCAYQFREEFQGVHRLKYMARNKDVGDVVFLRRNGNYIFYLITKKKFYHKPEYITLRASLRTLRQLCLNYGITRLAMPKLGTGLDQLSWHRVRMQIEHVFQDTDIDIFVYFLPN